MKTVSAILTGLSFVAAIACNQPTAAEEATEASVDAPAQETGQELQHDSEFAEEMAINQLLNLQLANLAEAKAESNRVKELALLVASESQAAGTELKTWAASNGIELPDELAEKEQQLYDELAEKEGRDFDEAYLDYLVDNHEEVIRDLERQSKRGNNSDLKDWASSKIPAWQNHLEMAERAEKIADDKD